MKRILWEVRWNATYLKGGCWLIYLAGVVTGVAKTKAGAVDLAASECKRQWEDMKILSELTIKKKNGQIQDKRTYGKDPRGTKG
jgi:Uncharacterized protein conserved in bacteria (DUF2188)